MPARPQTHRPSTIERRDALLRAAMEIVAEQGVGAVTHRAVAARAGLPLSTTSYFFDSLDELLLEALRSFAAQEIERYAAVAQTMAGQAIPPEQAIDAFVAILAAQPISKTIAQFEAYLEAARRPAVREEIARVLDAFAAPVAAALAATGIAEPEAAARACVALADGFALQRAVRGPSETEHAALAEALRRLLAGYGL